MSLRLVGDGLENPANSVALADVAAMFGVECAFRGGQGLPTVDTASLLAAPLVAVENVADATSVFSAPRPPESSSIVVGNERRGVRPDVLRTSASTVRIPMPGRGVNTLNVAAAAAVALYYLANATGRRRVRSARPESHRPAILLRCPTDHVEAGSSLRSAAAFGWTTAGIEDREKVWFGTPRSVRTEGRAAARSHRNRLRVVPVSEPPSAARLVVAGTRVAGPPLHHVDLVGPRTLLVIPDESGDVPEVGSAALYARVGLPGNAYRYRLVASIVLAEVARQLAVRTAARPSSVESLRYHSLLAVSAPEADLVTPSELAAYGPPTPADLGLRDAVGDQSTSLSPRSTREAH